MTIHDFHEFRTIRKVTDLRIETGDSLVGEHKTDSPFRISLAQNGHGISLLLGEIPQLLKWLNAVMQAEDDNAADAMLKGKPDERTIPRIRQGTPPHPGIRGAFGAL